MNVSDQLTENYKIVKGVTLLTEPEKENVHTQFLSTLDTSFLMKVSFFIRYSVHFLQQSAARKQHTISIGFDFYQLAVALLVLHPWQGPNINALLAQQPLLLCIISEEKRTK